MKPLIKVVRFTGRTYQRMGLELILKTAKKIAVEDFHESLGIPKDELRDMATKIELVDPLKDDRGKWVKDAIVTVTLTSKEKS